MQHPELIHFSTHMCHPDACTEADISPGLDSMQLGQNPPCVWCQGGQHFTIADRRENILVL